jgi:hypothetical protein
LISRLALIALTSALTGLLAVLRIAFLRAASLGDFTQNESLTMLRFRKKIYCRINLVLELQ